MMKKCFSNKSIFIKIAINQIWLLSIIDVKPPKQILSI